MTRPATAPVLGVIRTYSGRLIRPLDPAPGEISIIDIAHSLSQVCRFAGHTRVPYSVAQHSVEVSRRCTSSRRAALYGLLHDASEAYLTDVPSPLKDLDAFAHYRAAEARLQFEIYAHFRLYSPVPEDVWRADRLMLAVEIRDLMPAREGDHWIELAEGEPQLVPVDAIAAKAMFLERFCELGWGLVDGGLL